VRLLGKPRLTRPQKKLGKLGGDIVGLDEQGNARRLTPAERKKLNLDKDWPGSRERIDAMVEEAKKISKRFIRS
jgi:hypothetical protein